MGYGVWGRGHRARAYGTVCSLTGTLLLSSCAAAPFLIPVAIEFARNLIQTSLSNYGSKHRDNLSNLVGRLSTPYTQNLPQMAGSGPGMPAAPGFPQQGFPGQQGNPAQQAYPGQQTYPGQAGSSNPYGMPGGAPPGMGGYPGTTQGQYGTPSGYPAQPGYDPYNPYGSAGGTSSAAGSYPGTTQSQYGTASGYPAQPEYNPSNPYGTATLPNPYGTQDPYANAGSAGYPSQLGTSAPYGSANPYGGEAGYPPQSSTPTNPYGTSSQPYGSQNPYGSSGYPPQAGQANPYGTSQAYGGTSAQTPQTYDPNNPYGSTSHSPQMAQANPYGTSQAYGGTSAQTPQTYDPNNPYGNAGAGQAYGQSQSAYGQPQSAYGSPASHGTQQQPNAYGSGYGASGQQYGGQYGAAGVYPRGLSSEPVAVDVAMIRQKQTAKGKEVLLMSDGEVLRDGGSNKEAGDKFKVVVRTNCDCYLYIVAIDGSGWTQPVFPGKDKPTVNPVKKDVEYAFPEGPYWFSLDQVKGVETFYIVASANRRTDLEESFAQLASETRPSVTLVAKVEEPPVIPRGVGSVKPRGIITVKDEGGASAQVTPLSYAASQFGQDVTVTRWFKHE